MAISSILINNRYQLEQELKSNETTRTFTAVDLSLYRKVVLKFFKPDLPNLRFWLQQFQRETRLIANLRHANIVSIYDYGIEDNIAFLVTPFITGGSLETRLQQGQLGFQEIEYLLSQIASGLDYIHRQKFTHRKLKPSNILLQPNDQIVLGDFAILNSWPDKLAFSFNCPASMVNYAAPEYLDGYPRPQSDIYALGVTLYQMLTGQLPFAGTAEQVCSDHYSRPVPSLLDHAAFQKADAQLTQRLDRVIKQAMAKTLNSRFSTVSDLLNAYREAVCPGKFKVFAPELISQANNPVYS